MIKILIQNILPGVVYLIVYVFLRYLLSLSEPISISFLVAIIVIVQMKLGTIIKNVKLKTAGGEFDKVEQAINIFSERLNNISHYHELFPEIL